MSLTLNTAEAGAIVARMRQRNPKADPLTALPDVDPRRIPRPIAIILDGNGRGVEIVTLYSFSMENWKRPPEEIEALMALCITYLEGERDHLKRENIRLKVIGRRAGLPGPVVAAIADVERTTAGCTGGTLCLAINYSARAEIADAARALATEAREGKLDPASVDEAAGASIGR